MRHFIALALIFSTLTAFGNGVLKAQYPLAPDPGLTPGSLCTQPDEFRYAEHIAYCSRHVKSALKHNIIADYDSKLGYSIDRMNRGEFKIDHYIPLCMGGSNSRSNLWPQHRSIYMETDDMEGPLCEKMAEGVLSQADAVKLIKEGKNDLSRIPEIMTYINGL